MGMGMYGGLSFGDVALAAIVLAVFLIPIARILHRAGRNRAWCLLFLVPFGNIIGLWAFAYTRWPGVEEKRVEPPEFH
jgi:predicted PurR-regulated permease PerM